MSGLYQVNRKGNQRDILRQLIAFSFIFLLVVIQNIGVVYASSTPFTGNTFDDCVSYANDYGIDFPADWETMIALVEEYSQVDENGVLVNDPTSIENVTTNVFNTYSLYSTLVNRFGSKSKYDKFKKAADEVLVVEDGTYRPSQDNAGDSFMKRYKSVITNFNSHMSAGKVGSIADQIFGTSEFDPKNNFFTPAMDWFYYIINTLFSILSQLMMWLSLLQIGADILYITVDFTRKWLVPFKDAGGGGAAGSGGGKGFRLPIISEEADKAVHGGASGGVSGGGGDHAISQHKVVSYVLHRSPIVILGAVFLVMTIGGWWSKFISICSALVVAFFEHVLTFFNLM